MADTAINAAKIAAIAPKLTAAGYSQIAAQFVSLDNRADQSVSLDLGEHLNELGLVR